MDCPIAAGRDDQGWALSAGVASKLLGVSGVRGGEEAELWSVMLEEGGETAGGAASTGSGIEDERDAGHHLPI